MPTRSDFVDTDLPVRNVLVRIGGKRVLVCEPNWRSYGHLALETLYALHLARGYRARLFLLGRRTSANPAIYHLTVEGMTESHPNAVTSALARLALMRRPSARGPLAALRRGLLSAVDSLPFISAATRKKIRGRLKQAKALGKPRTRKPYFRRSVAVAPLSPRLCPSYERAALAAAARAGIDVNAPLVTLHVREAGYKLGREIQDAKPGATRDDSVRNADIASYVRAVDMLAERGYTIVRLGDPTMAELERPNVIDLAQWTGDGRPALEVWCLLRSRFLIGSESGPSYVAFLTGTPTLVANATDPISSFPLRRTDIYLLKAVRERASGRTLELDELLTADYLKNVRNTALYEYVDNTPEEIRAAVAELLELLERDVPETPAQRAFREAATRSALELAEANSYVRKWGAEAGFFGEGRIARTAVGA